jgi:hypothetical protein
MRTSAFVIGLVTGIIIVLQSSILDDCVISSLDDLSLCPVWSIKYRFV